MDLIFVGTLLCNIWKWPPRASDLIVDKHTRPYTFHIPNGNLGNVIKGQDFKRIQRQHWKEHYLTQWNDAVCESIHLGYGERCFD